MTSNIYEIEDKARLVAAAKKALETPGAIPKKEQERVQQALVRDAERQQASRTHSYREITDNNTIGLAAARASQYGLVPSDQALSDDINRAQNAKRRADRERTAARLHRDTRTRQRETPTRGR